MCKKFLRILGTHPAELYQLNSMPKRTRSGRVKGYHYAKRRDGTRYRVYAAGSRASKRATTRSSSRGRPAPKSYKRSSIRRAATDFYGDTIMGTGSYRQNRSKTILGGNPPVVKNSSGGFTVRHREFVGDLNTSQAFSVYGFAINPGNPQLFPWASQIAPNFEEWVPKGIVLSFKSTSSDSVVSTNANAALGTVIMATQYNPYNGTFANKVQMENYEWAKSCKPSQSMMHPVECNKSQNVQGSYFTRTDAVPAGQDQRLYDIGIFQIAAVGMQSNGAPCGELWISYEIEFRKPKIQIGEAGDIDANAGFDHIVIFGTTPATAGVLPATPFGTSTTVPLYPTVNSSLGGVACGGIVTAASFAPQPLSPTKNNFVGGIPTLVGSGSAVALPGATSVSVPTGTLGNSAANTYYFPPGQSQGNFLVQYNALYTTGGANWTPVQSFTNCQALNLLSTDTINFQANLSATTSTSCMATFVIKIIGANASFAFPGSTGAYATPIYADLFVTQIPDPVS